MRITHGLHYMAAASTAITIGNFDGVHLGHRLMLQRLDAHARHHRQTVTVLSFEPHPREWFAPEQAPARLSSLRDKLACLQQLGVDHVHILPFNAQLAAMTAHEFVENLLLRQFHMQHLVVGDDFCFGARRAGNIDLLQQLGKQNRYSLDIVPGLTKNGTRISSTAIRTALADANLELAKQMLGRPFSISGHVVHGDKRGRELGFPTANLRILSVTPPLTGVFYVQIRLSSEQVFPAVANLGVRPTLNDGKKSRLEVHIPDFSGNLYGRIVQVTFLAHIRAERSFTSLDALRHQIAADVAQMRDIFRLPVSA